MQTYVPPEAVRWGIRDAIIGLAVFIAVILLGVAFVVTTHPDAENPDVVGAFALVSTLAGYGALFIVIVLASRRRGLGSLRADFGFRLRPVDLAIGLGIGLLAKIISVVIGVVAISITGHTPEQGNFVLPSSPLWIVVNGVLIATLIAPIMEELFFRGLVLRAIRNYVLRFRGRTQPAGQQTQETAIVVAILGNSIAFALLHLYESSDVTLLIALGGGTLVIGLLNSMIAIRTGRLGAAIVAHVVFNGISIVTAIAIA